MSKIPEFQTGAERSEGIVIAGQGRLYYPSGERRLSRERYVVQSPWEDPAMRELATSFVKRVYTTLHSVTPWDAEPKGSFVEKCARQRRQFFYTTDLPILRYSTARRTGTCPPRAAFQSFLEGVAAMSVDVSPLFPEQDVPVTVESMPNLRAYLPFGMAERIHQPMSWEGPKVLNFDFRDQRDIIERGDGGVESLLEMGTTSQWVNPRVPNALEPLRAIYLPFSTTGVYCPSLNNSPPGIISVDWSGNQSVAEGTDVPRAQQCDIGFPPSATPRLAAMFMHGFQKFDGLAVLDEYTVTPLGRVDGFIDSIAEEQDAEDFLNWLKEQRVMHSTIAPQLPDG